MNIVKTIFFYNIKDDFFKKISLYIFSLKKKNWKGIVSKFVIESIIDNFLDSKLITLSYNSISDWVKTLNVFRK